MGVPITLKNGYVGEQGLVLVTHFISKYPWVTAAKAQITAHPWERITDRAGQQHSHAFISSPSMTRVAEVVMTRGSRPSISRATLTPSALEDPSRPKFLYFFVFQRVKT